VDVQRKNAKAEALHQLELDSELARGNARAANGPAVSVELNPKVDDANSVPLTEVLPDDSLPVSEPKEVPTEPSPSADPSPKPETPDPKVTEPKTPPMVTVVLSADDKRFADVSVRKGTTVNFGTGDTLVVRTRGGVEVDNTYIRFDLGKISGVRKTIVEAELILTVPEERPIGSSIRLYGVPLKPKDMLWPEHRVVWRETPSDIGTDTSPSVTLDKIPVLEKREIGKATNANDELKIRFSNQELVKFISQSPNDVVTFAIAGAAKEKNAKIEFVSSEHDTLKAFAPKLLVRLPKPPPTKAKDDLKQIREAISQLKGWDTKPLERIIKLVENGQFDKAGEASDQLVEKIRDMKLPERISKHAVKTIESIKIAAEKLQEKNQSSRKSGK